MIFANAFDKPSFKLYLQKKIYYRSFTATNTPMRPSYETCVGKFLHRKCSGIATSYGSHLGSKGVGPRFVQIQTHMHCHVLAQRLVTSGCFTKCLSLSNDIRTKVCQRTICSETAHTNTIQTHAIRTKVCQLTAGLMSDTVTCEKYVHITTHSASVRVVHKHT